MKAAFSGGQSLMRFLRFVLPLVMCMFAAGAFAQGGNVAITGTVMDPSGAVVVGAKVTVTQQGTQTVRTDTTDSNGQFNVTSIPPAGYSIAVEATGFKKYVEKVVLLADQTHNMMIHLQLGSANQEITVETSSAQVNTVSQELSQVIERSRVVDLPLNGRNAADLTLLVPGAVTAIANNSGTLQGNSKQIPGAEAISVNGARPDQIGYNLDGGSNEDLMSNTNDPFPFPDALQEFSVQTNSFDVQYGANAGAVVNIITKSGTNQWHGDAFEFVRNRVFNARTYFANKVDPLKRNQFGATAGGPIHKNTSFIFVGWQKTIIRTQNSATNAFIPIPQNLTGDFTNYLTPNAPNNPLSGGKTATLSGDPWNHTPFAQTNMIPSSGPGNLIDPVALKIINNYLPMSSESPNGFVTFATPLRDNYNEYITRFDQTLRGGQDHLFGRFYLDRYIHSPTYDGKNLLTVGTGSTVQTQNWALGYTSVLSSDLVNNLVLYVQRSDSDRSQQGGPGGTVPDWSTFGSSVPQLPKGQSGVRQLAISGFFTVAQFTDGVFVRNTAGLRDVLSWTKGKHNFEFGYDLELDQANVRNTDLEDGSFNFTNDVTGLALASFMMGYQHQFSQTSGNYSDSRENPMGVFAGDKWKLSNRLTVDLGLRYEPQQVMKEIRGRIEQFRPDAYAANAQSAVITNAPAGLFFIGDSYNGISVPDRGETGDFNNFGPRVGFAWDPTGTGKMSLRGGGGLFYYSRLPGLFLNDASISAPFSLRIDLNDSASGPSQIGSLTDPEVNYPAFKAAFPQRFTLAQAPKNATFIANPQIYSLQPGVKWVTPEVYDWNITYEYQLRPDTVLHASYVGTRGIHLRQDINLNPGVYTAGSTASLQARRIYQPFGVIYEDRNTGASGYNGLELSFEKRPVSSGGNILNRITLLANYTLSKAMDYGLAENGGITDIGSSIGSGMSVYDPRQHAFETGPATFDHRHHFVASYVWDLPKLASSNGLVRNTVGGWEWTGIYNFTSGDPLTILAGTDQSKTGNNLDRADFVGSGSIGQRGTPTPCTASHCLPWLNTSMFAAPAPGTYGNSGKGNWRGPNLWNVDTGLIKNIVPVASHENISFQFRAEIFDIFNHPQWSDPNVTFTNAAFGTVTSTVAAAAGNIGTGADSRIMQFALKMNF